MVITGPILMMAIPNRKIKYLLCSEGRRRATAQDRCLRRPFASQESDHRQLRIEVAALAPGVIHRIAEIERGRIAYAGAGDKRRPAELIRSNIPSCRRRRARPPPASRSLQPYRSATGGHSV